LFVSAKTEKKFEEKPNNIIVVTKQISYGFGYLKLNNLFRYSQPFHGNALFINAGISNGYVISETNHLRKSTIGLTSTIVEEQKALEYTRKHEQGILLGLGGAVKRYSLELRYEVSNGVSDYSNYKSSVKRYFILLGYRFR
jgi:hypothetical protein